MTCSISGESKPEDGFKCCESCRAQARAYWRQWTEKNRDRKEAQRRRWEAARRQSGLCRQCPRPRRENAVLCPECIQEKQQQRLRLAAEGKCGYCGKVLDSVRNRSRCTACQRVAGERARARKDALRARGFCIRNCGRPISARSRNLCEAHLTGTRIFWRIEDRRRRRRPGQES